MLYSSGSISCEMRWSSTGHGWGHSNGEASIGRWEKESRWIGSAKPVKNQYQYEYQSSTCYYCMYGRGKLGPDGYQRVKEGKERKKKGTSTAGGGEERDVQ